MVERLAQSFVEEDDPGSKFGLMSREGHCRGVVA
jgi:hypothetical protein